ncbi:hypothetical protein [Streptomyces sp. RK75]|uniref:hypothetical protein n=1 Tax=Streptomyces sp. RK75 TaxID=2824895 RepID=UPI001B3900E7|nr:hypothetical protein [Streptomyces sp. RK75]MBQ0867391.1 hypothetical protein [Streptomyces sp. RK75]
MTPAQFRSAHGPCTTWSVADIEGYEHLVETASPELSETARTGQLVVGRRATGDRVVVDLTDPAGLIGTVRSGKTNAAAALRHIQRRVR